MNSDEGLIRIRPRNDCFLNWLFHNFHLPLYLNRMDRMDRMDRMGWIWCWLGMYFERGSLKVP